MFFCYNSLYRNKNHTQNTFDRLKCHCRLTSSPWFSFLSPAPARLHCMDSTQYVIVTIILTLQQRQQYTVGVWKQSVWGDTKTKGAGSADQTSSTLTYTRLTVYTLTLQGLTSLWVAVFLCWCHHTWPVVRTVADWSFSRLLEPPD